MEEIRQCFRRINRWAKSYVLQHTKETRLTPSQLEALRHIAYHGTLNQQELVRDLGIDKAAVTRLLVSLEEEGYITRSPDPGDGRAKLIHATDKTYQAQGDVVQLENAYYDWLLDGLSPAERETFEKQLDTLLQRAREGRRNGYADLNERGRDDTCT